MEIDPANAQIGFVAAGTAFDALRQALLDLGFDDAALHEAGVRLMRIGMIYPLDADRIEKFASGLDTVVVVEDKASFMETQLREILFGHANVRAVLGKRDRDGRPLIPADTELTAPRLERPLRQILGDRLTFPEAQPTATNLQLMLLPLARTAYFCSGCPHNRSTVVPCGFVAGGGIGCHSMVTIEARPVECGHRAYTDGR